VATYKDFLPAMRGCVAQDPPRTMLCFSSKKSAGDCDVSKRGGISRSNENKIRTCISRVQSHGRETVVRPKRRAGPLPYAPHLGLAGELVSFTSYCDRMPLLKANVGTVKIDEELLPLTARRRTT
jgi:hypothetical protein